MEKRSGSRSWSPDHASTSALCVEETALALPRAARMQALARRVADQLQAADLRAVGRVTRTARRPLFKALAIGISRLGNGWIYPLLLAVLLVKLGYSSAKIIVCAGLSATLLHLIYPVMKKAFGRRRPFQVAPELPNLLATLDSHSFPSGHTMTMVGVLTPIVMLWPAAMASALVVAGSMAWSRIATAHHYPTDVLAGAALGLGISYPTTIVILHVWS